MQYNSRKSTSSNNNIIVIFVVIIMMLTGMVIVLLNSNGICNCYSNNRGPKDQLNISVLPTPWFLELPLSRASEPEWIFMFLFNIYHTIICYIIRYHAIYRIGILMFMGLLWPVDQWWLLTSGEMGACLQQLWKCRWRPTEAP